MEFATSIHIMFGLHENVCFGFDSEYNPVYFCVCCFVFFGGEGGWAKNDQKNMFSTFHAKELFANTHNIKIILHEHSPENSDHCSYDRMMYLYEKNWIYNF